LATLAAGANWGMEFADTAMHFRFRLKGDARKFLRACKYPFFPFSNSIFRHYSLILKRVGLALPLLKAAMAAFAKSWRQG